MHSRMNVSPCVTSMWQCLSGCVRRVAVSLGSGLVVAVITARTVLPLAVRLMAKHATPELYQLTVVAFCLCCGWLSGYMVRSCWVLTPTGKAGLPCAPSAPLN